MICLWRWIRADWIQTGRTEWRTLREVDGFARQRQYMELIDLRTGDKRWKRAVDYHYMVGSVPVSDRIVTPERPE